MKSNERTETEEMRKDTLRVLAVCLLGPALVTPMALLGQPGLAWWRYLALVVGWAYLIPVSGVLLKRWMANKCADRARLSRLAVRSCVVTLTVFTLLVTFFVISEPSLENAREQIIKLIRWEVAALLLSIGLISAIPDGRRAEAWLRQWHHRQTGFHDRKPR